MGGQLYLNNGKAPNRDNVCISGYRRGHENFALSNFDDNDRNGYYFFDPDLKKIIHFPTSEHYLHFQKMTPAAKVAKYSLWSGESSPTAILRGITDSRSPYYISDEEHAYKIKNNATNTYEFEKVRWDRDKVNVQMQINASKYMQSSEFKSCIDMSIALGQSFGDGKGPATIIEDTSTASRLEAEWGTGTSGKGNNILGNSQTAFAAIVENGSVPLNTRTPGLDSYKNSVVDNYYSNTKAQFMSGFQKTLVSVRAFYKGQSPTDPTEDTSDLGNSLVRKVRFANGIIQVQSFAPVVGAKPAQNPVLPKHQDKKPVNTPEKLDSGEECFYSRGSNQRLLIKKGEIVGYQFRADPSSPWKQGAKKHFTKLEDSFNSATGKFYYSNGKNQRLVIDDGQVVGFQYRAGPLAFWQKGDAKYFANLQDSFNKMPKDITTPTGSEVNALKSHYEYASNSNSRFHALEASSQHYKNFRGDVLKTKILSKFKSELEGCTEFLQLQNKVIELKNSDEYKILAKGQGLTTRMFGLKTSSVDAFNKMVDEIKQNFSSSPKNKM